MLIQPYVCIGLIKDGLQDLIEEIFIVNITQLKIS